jgi:hypothetical protein
MPFPVSWSGKFEVAVLGPPPEAELAARVERLLSRENPSELLREGNSVTFRGRFPLFLWWFDRTRLHYVSSGRVDLSSRSPGISVRLTLRFGHMAAFIALFVASFIGLPLIILGIPWHTVIICVLVGWFGLFAPQYFLTAWLLRKHLRKSCRALCKDSAEETAPNQAVPADRDPRERGSRPLNSHR